MNNDQVKIEEALPCNLSDLCSYCLKYEVEKVVLINENIKIHFCGREDCKEVAINNAKDILKSLKKK